MATTARSAPGSGGTSLPALGAAVALQIAVTLPMFLVSTLAPYLERDIGLTERSLGLAIGAFYLVSAATAVWLGRVADRQTWQRGLLITATGALVPAGLLAGVVSHPVAVAAAMVLLALVQSMAVGTANMAIVDSVARTRQGLAFGVKQAAVPAATLLAGLSAPLVADRFGWRWAFVLAGAFPLLALAFAGLHDRDSTAGQRADPARSDHPVPPERARRLRALAVAFGVATFTTSSLGAFFVLFAVERGMAPAAAGLTVAVASTVNVCMRVAMGWLADRYRGEAFVRAGALLAAGSVGYFLLMEATGWLLVAGAVLAYGLGWAWQGLIHLGAVRFVPDAPGYATGLVRTGLAIGSGTGPIASGLLIGVAGYRLLWLVLGLLALGAAGASFLTIRRPPGAAR